MSVSVDDLRAVTLGDLAASRAAWAALAESLPRCADCDGPATCTAGAVRVCDRHGGASATDLAEGPLVRAITLLAEGAS